MVADCASCTGKCQCFQIRRKQEYVQVVRYSTIQWRWTHRHGLALQQSACFLQLDIPKEIVSMIKEHCFDAQQPLNVVRPVVRTEPSQQMKQQDLLRRKLCTHSKQFYRDTHDSSLSISLHSSDTARSKQVFNCLRSESLPALQLKRGDSEHESNENCFRRTIFIDDFQFKLDLTARSRPQCPAEGEDDDASSEVHIVVLHEEDSVNWINETCKRIWSDTQCMKNVFIFNRARKHKKLVQQVANYWNIACFQANSNHTQSAKNVLQFAVKYHWLNHAITA